MTVEAPVSFTEALDSAFDGGADSAVDQTPAPATETVAETTTKAPEAAEAVEDTAETPEVDEATTSAPEAAEEPEDAVLSLSPQELAEIKANPATAKLYKSLMRASTAKFQEISADKRFLENIRANPRAVLESAARNMGLELRDPQEIGTKANSEAVVDDVMQDMVNLFGPDLAPAVRPVMERMVQNLVDKQVAPIKQSHEQLQQQSYEKQAKAFADTFRARHKDELTPDLEAKMTEIGKRISPNEGTTPDEYLEMIFSVATAGKTAAKTAKVAAERIRAAQANAEPRRNAPPARVTPKANQEITLDEAFENAWAEIQQG